MSWQNEAGPRYLGINSGYIPTAALPQGLLSPVSAVLSWEGPPVFQLAVLKARAHGCVTVLSLSTTAQTAAQGSTVFPCHRGTNPTCGGR